MNTTGQLAITLKPNQRMKDASDGRVALIPTLVGSYLAVAQDLCVKFTRCRRVKPQLL